MLPELRQGAINVGAALMTTKQPRDFRARQTIGGSEKCLSNMIGDRITHARAEDVLGGGLHILPEGEGSQQMLLADGRAAVEERVNTGYTNLRRR